MATLPPRQRSRDIARVEARDLLMCLERTADTSVGQQLAMFEWNGALYAGLISRPYPEKPYIVFVRKQTDPVSGHIASAVRRMDGVPVVKVPTKVEFAGSSYMLGLTGGKLVVLSGEDIMYCHVHPRQPAGEAYQTGAELLGFQNP